MFIISKLDVINNRVFIVDVIEEEGAFMDAYESILNDIIPYLEKQTEYSTKNITKSRVEVFKRTFTGNILNFVYEIHPHDEPQITILKNDK